MSVKHMMDWKMNELGTCTAYCFSHFVIIMQCNVAFFSLMQAVSHADKDKISSFVI